MKRKDILENSEEIASDNASKTAGQTVATPYIDKKRRVFDIIYFCLVSVYILVMCGTGFNFLPLIAIVLSIIAAIILLVRAVKKKGVGIFVWLSYVIGIAGTFIYFLIWGAEGFGKAFWWNLVLSFAPILLAFVVLFANKAVPKKALRATTAAAAFLMAGTALIYVFFMNLRTTPTVDSLQRGHDDYLASLKNQPAGADSPNVLVILMDDMAYSDISLFSYLGSEGASINTPNIDRIADNGIAMDNFYSSSPVCSPSRFSLLTGRYSSRGYLDNVVFPTTVESTPYSVTHFLNPYQFLNNVDGILGDEITFAETLQATGYSTACIGKWNLGDYGQYLPTNQGFDYFYGSYYVNDMTPYDWVRDTGGNHPEGVTHRQIRTHQDNLDQSESTKIFTAEIVNFIESSVENNEKFLAYYTTPWPHYPIFSDNNGNGKGDTSDDTYIACIEEFDKYLGTILDTLEQQGVYDDTLIIFTSDNGPGREGVTGALRGRKNTTFDGGMKVPLLASYPNGGVGAGSALDSRAYDYYAWDKDENGNYTSTTTKKSGTTKHIESSSMNFDLFATILDYCGITAMPADRVIDGVSLRELWSGNVAADTRVHEALYYQKKGKVQAVQMAVELNGKVYDFKYYDKVLTENSAFIDQYYKNYLFNLDADPAEGYDIAKTYPEIASELNARLNAFRKEMKTDRRGMLC